MAASKKKSTAAKKPAKGEGEVPDRIFAQASPRSIGGVSMFDVQEKINVDTVANFFSSPDLVQRAAMRLQDAGFEVLQVTPMTINIAGSSKTYQRAFNTKIVAEEKPVIKEFGVKDTATFLDSPDTALPGLIATTGTPFEDVLEGVAIEEPRYFMAASMFAPLKSYWHLRVPGDVSLGVNADKAHRSGITGKGVKVVMADSGWFKHPYFVGRGYKAGPVVLGPGTANPLKDENGHGTGESANVFAAAPDVDFQMVKLSFVNTIGGFNAAVALNPHIISCSWGSHKPHGPLSAADQALAAAIAAAVASGIVVIFSAGNSQAGFPGQHPDVISAGGVFMNPDESLEASNYASGFMSTIYANRRVPDVCGLVGMKPRAIYIMLPLEPGDAIDVDLAGGTHPNKDETANNDGWAAFSGTSAAAPQLAGVAALIKQACPALKPKDVRDIMMKTARDVTKGKCNGVSPFHTGLSATVGPDGATGEGLVDAHKAVMVAKVRCTAITPGPITPIIPIHPVTPSPVAPVQPIGPIGPIQPIQPITPSPVAPVHPIRPIGPIILPAPTPVPAEGTMEAHAAPPPGPQLSAEDAKTLEDMIISSEVDIDT